MWLAWEEQAKVVCQWVHPKPRREFLQRRLCGGVSGMASSLDAGCERFAVWRWKTLLNVAQDLLRMQEALRNATVGLRTADLGPRDRVSADAFLTAVQSETVWVQCHALHSLAKPVGDFS